MDTQNLKQQFEADAPQKEASEFLKEIKVDDDGEHSPDNIIKIYENSNFKLGTAGRIYDCSIILAKYLLRQNDLGNQKLRGKNILELGCGTGCLSLFLASQGANVVATDLKITQNFVEKNLQMNKELVDFHQGTVKFVALDWNEQEEKIFQILKSDIGFQKIDYIVASDTYFNSAMLNVFSRLLKSVSSYYQQEGCSFDVFISYKQRLHEDINQDPILQTFQEYKFIGERIHKSELDSNYKQKDIEIFKLEF
ncbi:hypothetical protein ABPG74_002208 [Tetrahymena malaccensis]